MPNIQSAKKAARQNEKRRVFNLRRKQAVLRVTKEIRKMVTTGQKEKAKTMVSRAYKAIDKAAKTGVIKKNTAARKKSQLSRLTR